jgi:hypothetical protein
MAAFSGGGKKTEDGRRETAPRASLRERRERGGCENLRMWRFQSSIFLVQMLRCAKYSQIQYPISEEKEQPVVIDYQITNNH